MGEVSVVMLTKWLSSDTRSLATSSLATFAYSSSSPLSTTTATKSTSATTTISITYLQSPVLTSKGRVQPRQARAPPLLSASPPYNQLHSQAKDHNTQCLPAPLNILSLPTSSTLIFVRLYLIKKMIMIPNVIPFTNMCFPYPPLLFFLRISSRVQPSPSGYVPFLSINYSQEYDICGSWGEAYYGEMRYQVYQLYYDYITGFTPPILSENHFSHIAISSEWQNLSKWQDFLSFDSNLHNIIAIIIFIRTSSMHVYCYQASKWMPVCFTQLVVIFAHRNRVCSLFLEFLLIVEGGGTLDERIPEGLFWRFPTKFACIFSPIKTEFVLCFWSFCRS